MADNYRNYCNIISLQLSLIPILLSSHLYPVSVSHLVAVTSSQPVMTDILAQLKDPLVKQLHSGLSSASKPVITDETQPQLKQYLQIWQQLSVMIM